MDPETLQDVVDLIVDGGTVVCNAATRDRFQAALRDAGAPATSIRFRVSAHQPDMYVTVIALDGGDPQPYALTAEAMPYPRWNVQSAATQIACPGVICSHRWEAVFPIEVPALECPECGHPNRVPGSIPPHDAGGQQ